MLVLCQVELLHPVGGELIGGYSRKSGAMKRLDREQQQQNSRKAQVSQKHDVTYGPDFFMSVYKGRLMLEAS